MGAYLNGPRLIVGPVLKMDVGDQWLKMIISKPTLTWNDISFSMRQLIKQHMKQPKAISQQNTSCGSSKMGYHIASQQHDKLTNKDWRKWQPHCGNTLHGMRGSTLVSHCALAAFWQSANANLTCR